MAKKTIGITGTPGRSYDLDKIEQDNRLNSNQQLIVQVHKYKAGENPNPPDLKIGQIWISQLVTEDESGKSK